MAKLPDNDLWTNRIEITGSSGRVYIVAQNKAKRYWGCDCPGWKSRKNCKHLKQMGLPGDCVAFELKKNDFTSGYKQAPKPGSPADWAKEIDALKPPEKPLEKFKRQFDFGDEEDNKK
ncbi:MAG TPA: hypothetical protein VNX68_19190 [Nitrosopumilaceae archaeon]|jgi:hypothetical protein|nr:hypothetical protein [Nitrosopumilaceae archaeon]